MIVFNRKLGEKIYIGQNICITVVDIDRDKIRLGIEAPRDVPIYRQEQLPLNQALAETHTYDVYACQGKCEELWDESMLGRQRSCPNCGGQCVYHETRPAT